VDLLILGTTGTGTSRGPCENEKELSVSVINAEFLNLVKLSASIFRGVDLMTPVCVLNKAMEEEHLKSL
jgi:hypothetical protein